MSSSNFFAFCFECEKSVKSVNAATLFFSDPVCFVAFLNDHFCSEDVFLLFLLVSMLVYSLCYDIFKNTNLNQSFDQ